MRMELLLGIMGIGLLFGLPVGAVMGMIAWSRLKELTTKVAQLEQQQRQLRMQFLIANTTPSAEREPLAPVPTIPKPVPAATPAVPATLAPTLAPPALIPIETTVPVLRVDDEVAEAPSMTADIPMSPPPVVAEPVPVPEPVSASAPVFVSAPTVPVPAAPAPTPRPVAAPPAVSPFEAIIGKRWLTWAGVALVFLSGVFLLKYAYDQEWIGHLLTPPIRIAGIALAAGAMLAVGLRFMRQGLEALGQGLAGGGIAIAYLAVYGGFSPAVMLTPEPLFPGQLAFALMALVTVIGMTLAVRADARALAVCAVIGGFATPALIDTGGGSREALFAYLLILDVGVLAVALFRRWRLLDVVAFAGTAVLYAAWQHGREPAHAAPWAMLAWLLVFHQVFVTLPFLHHWRQRSVVTIERFALAVGNLAFTLAYAAVLLVDQQQLALAVVCLSLAGLYGIIGVYTRMRIPDDHKVGHGFIALGTMLVTLGLFYLLPVEAIATAWIVEAVTLVVLGYRYTHAPTRVLAHVILAIAIIRLTYLRFPATDLEAPLLWNLWFMSLAVAPLGAAAMAEAHRRCGSSESDRRAQKWCWWSAGLLLLFIGSGEISRHASGHPQAWSLLPETTRHSAWWAIGCLGFLAAAWRWSSSGTARLALFPGVAGILLGMAAYGHAWPGGIPVANPRFIAALMALATVGGWLYAARKSASRLGDTTALYPVLLTLVQLGAVLLATLETMSWYGRPLADHPDSTATTTSDLCMTLTAVWAAAAFIGLFASLITRQRQMAQIAVLPLLAAVLTGFGLYLDSAPLGILFANQRFLVLTFAVVVVGCQRLVFTQTTWLPSLTQILATAALNCELLRWSNDTYPHAVMVHALWATALIWAGSAAIAAGRWRRGASSDARDLAATLAVLAAIPALVDYCYHWSTWLPFANVRALAPMAAVAALAWTWRANRDRARDLGQASSATLAWLAVVIGFIAGTCEAPLHYLQAIADPALASRVATFSITVVWVVMAAVALTIGFRWRLPMVRYLALGLFTLTAAKLVLIDMSGVQQLYRILSFMLVGIALIGASYAYHRLERRLLGEERSDDSRRPPAAG